MKRIGKWTLRIVMGLTLLVGLGSLLIDRLTEEARMRLQEEIDAVNWRGGTLRMEYLVPPAVPGESNGADDYARAADLLTARSAEECLAFREMMKDPFRADERHANILTGWVERNRQCLDALNAGSDRAYFRVNARFDVPSGLEGMIPSLQFYRETSNLYAAKMLLAVRHHRWDDVFANLREGIRHTSTLDAMPVLISGTVRHACVSLLVETTRMAIRDTVPPEGTCIDLLHILDGCEPARFLARALEGERCFIHTAYEANRRGEWEDFATHSEPVAVAAGFPAPFWPTDLALCVDEIWILRATARWIERLRGLHPFRCWKDLEGYSPWYVSKDDLPFMGAIMEQSACLEAKIGMTRLGLRLILHQAREGVLPETLDDLLCEPSATDPLPLDPFSGGPFRYRAMDGGGFTIRGVGPDRRSDGGEDSGNEGPGTLSERDMVWRWRPPRDLNLALRMETDCRKSP